MPSSEQVRQYQQTTRNLAENAGIALKRQLRAYLGENPGATAAEAREYAKGAAAGVVTEFSQASGVLAEQLYAAEFGSLPSGYIESVVNADAIDAAVRYRVCDLVDGDVDGFVDGMGEWAAQASFNACNTRTLQLAHGKKSTTQMQRERRARRRAEHDTWFARVPSGVNTCAWCAMLASRGYVYWTEETAGKFSKWHDNCRCTVVATTRKGGIEGYDPTVWEALFEEYEKIEASGLPAVQQKAVKLAYADSLGAYGGDQAELADAFQAAISNAWASFAKEKSFANYESTMSPLVEEIGAAYGATWSLGSDVNSAGTRVYARPNGDELWVAAKIASTEDTLRFLSSDQSLTPDVETTSSFAEIKCPSSVGKVSSRLRHAKAQLEECGAEGGTTYLGLQRMSDTARARAIAADMQSTCAAVNVWCVMPDGSVVRP
jgi:hypothetical protein